MVQPAPGLVQRTGHRGPGNPCLRVHVRWFRGQYEVAFTNSWVAASKTPDGRLAVLYLPNHTTVTIDQALLTPGYQAYWIDPVTGVKALTTSGSTYNSTAKGSNSQGDPDWVLAFQAPAVNAGPALYGFRS